jgi:hypothetical protein
MSIALETFSLEQNKKKNTSILISNLTSILLTQCKFLTTKRLIFYFPKQTNANFDVT